AMGAALTIGGGGAATATGAGPGWGSTPPAAVDSVAPEGLAPDTAAAPVDAVNAVEAPSIVAPVSIVDDAPVATAPTAPLSAEAAPRVDGERDQRYLVRRGDSLWAIASHYLGPTATASEIDATRKAIYRAIVAAIVGNPSLIFSGQQLTVA